MKLLSTLLGIWLFCTAASAQLYPGGGAGITPTASCGDASHALNWNGSAYGCQSITGSAAAGGSTTQFQYNNGGSLGGNPDWTFNGTHTSAIGASGIFDMSAMSVANLKFPSAFATGIVTVTTGTGALGSVAAPAGTIVGTSDSQALTNKNLTGAGNTFPTFPLSQLANQAANTILGNYAAGSAAPTAGAAPAGGTNGCSGVSDGVIYTASTGWGCHQDAITIGGTSVAIGGSTSSFPAPGAIGGTTPSTGAFTTLTGTTLNTTTKCAAAGSAANPSLVACSAASAGLFSCATNASAGTCVISTTAVTANSVIQIQPDSTLGTALSVTCNTSADTGVTAPRISARSAATSFTITLGTFTTNPQCFSYLIIN